MNEVVPDSRRQEVAPLCLRPRPRRCPSVSDEPSRDDALLWLNDGLDKGFTIWTGINRGDLGFGIFEVTGELRSSSS
jgi:hypothetical protein